MPQLPTPRSAAILFIMAACLGGTGCTKDNSSSPTASDDEAPVPATDSAGEPAESPAVASAASGPCALTEAQVSEVIGDQVTEVMAQGNWGIASTCTYVTATSPVAVELSSVASTDTSSDRRFDGARDIPDLGDEAVWVPALSLLTVVDKGNGKLLRIKVGMPLSGEERLQLSVTIARLALQEF